MSSDFADRLCPTCGALPCDQTGTPKDGWGPIEITPRATVITDITNERRRQIEVEGWTPEHDDEHLSGELAAAAACYAAGWLVPNGAGATIWPWSEDWWKPSADRRRELVKAGALIVAEIERIDRAEKSQ